VNFRHYTDESVTLAVDLVNTYWWAAEKEELPDVAALQAWIGAHDLTGAVDGRQLAEVRAYRSRLRDAFEAPDDRTAAEIINSLLADCGARPRIAVHDGDPVHMHFEPAGAGFAKWVGATAAMGLATVLCDYGKDRLGICAAARCRDAFIDTSKNKHKRYCDDTCANRENVAAYRARLRTEELG
jgi:predicted RNA-binding Zn ribbon-like protein